MIIIKCTVCGKDEARSGRGFRPRYCIACGIKHTAKQRRIKHRMKSGASMVCNNCGGQMLRSNTREHVTVCACGMEHHWHVIIARGAGK